MPPVYPSRVKIVEVGPRDGLQNENLPIPTEIKQTFIQKLVDAGLNDIEVTSFVHPQRIPQLADAEAVIAGLPTKTSARFSTLVPNQRGLDRALESGIKRIAVFTAASETFTQKNIGMTIEESLKTFQPVVQKAMDEGLTVRGYVSTCFICPYEGVVDANKVLDVTQALLHMGIEEVSLGDTLGAAVPLDVHRRLDLWLKELTLDSIALHFHDTYGTALANVVAGLEHGIVAFDSSAGGLGGCPYAPGASGNLATEDLIYLLDAMEIQTGVSLIKVAEASQFIQPYLGHTLPSKQFQRIEAQCTP